MSNTVRRWEKKENHLNLFQVVSFMILEIVSINLYFFLDFHMFMYILTSFHTILQWYNFLQYFSWFLLTSLRLNSEENVDLLNDIKIIMRKIGAMGNIAKKVNEQVNF